MLNILANAADILSMSEKCNIDHVAIKNSPAWDSLQFVGLIHLEADKFGPDEILELRNCGCNTLSKKIK